MASTPSPDLDEPPCASASCRRASMNGRQALALHAGATARARGDDDDITHVTVPGALEIPLALARLGADRRR